MAFQNAEAIQKLYVAFFNRPADYYGLQYWDEVITKSGNADAVIASLAATFAQSKEYTDTYAGQNTRQIINNIYKNLFGRPAEEAGLEYWNAEVTAGRVTLSNAVLMISGGAQNADKIAYASKVTAATSFTNALDTTDERLGYAGEKANAVAKTFIAGVTDATTLATAIAPANLDATVNQSIGAGTTSGTFTLTKGLDVITGSAGNDRVIAAVDTNEEVNTLSAVDSIDGGAGVDTLVLAAGKALATTDLANIKNIEVIEVQAAKAADLDTTGLTGVTSVSVTRAGGGDMKVTSAGTTDISMNVKASTYKTDLLGGKNVNLNLTDVTADTGDITIGSATKAATGAVVVATTGQAITAGAGAKVLEGVTVFGGKTVSVTEKATSDASAVAADTVANKITQGNVTVTGTGLTTDVSVKQDASKFGYEATTAVTAKATTQEIVFTAAKKGDIITVDFGAGTLAFQAKKDLTAAEVASAFANLTKDAKQGMASAQLGIYSDATGGVSDGFTSGAVQTVSATQSKVVFSSADPDAKLSVTSTGSSNTIGTAAPVSAGTKGVDADPGVLAIANGAVVVNDAQDTIKTVTVDGYGNTSKITGDGAVLETLNLSRSGYTYAADGSITASASFEVESTAKTLALNLTGVGASGAAAALTLTSAPTTLNVKSTGGNVVNLKADDTTTLNVTGTGTLNASSQDLVNLKTVKVSETAGLTLHADVASTLESVDTTGTTGTVTVSIQGNLSTYAGGAGTDNVTITNAATQIAKAIDLGAGNDRLTLSGLAVDPSVELKGGEGTDTLAVSAATAVARSVGVTFQDKISGFEKLDIGSVRIAGSVNLDNLDDINYVIVNGAGPAALGVATTAGTASTRETATVTFRDLEIGESFTVADLTVKATAASTAAEVAAVFASGTGTASLGVTGTLTNWTAVADTDPTKVVFSSTTATGDVANITTSSAITDTDALILDKMLANATIEMKGVRNLVEVKLADASGTADQVNVVTNGTTGTNLGQLTADKVETISITVNDTDTRVSNGVGLVSTNTLKLDADAASTIKIGGAGNLTLNLADDTTAVTMIDGSAATGILTISTLASDTAATTVKGGSADDVLTAFGANDVLQGGAGKDVLKVSGSNASAVTLTGGEGVDQFDVSAFKAANAGAAVTITDFTKGETIKFASDAAADFVSSKVTLIGEATFNDYVNEAAKAADTVAGGKFGIAWFQFNGNTFIVQDVDGGGFGTNDIIVKLTGLVDLSNSSFNDATQGTLLYI